MRRQVLIGLGLRAFIAAWSTCISTVASAGVTATFSPLGFLPGGPFTESVAVDLSRNGNAIVGFGSSANVGAVNDFEAFRWTANGGIEGLGSLGGSQFYSKAGAVSGNGQVVVGMSISPNGEEAFRWTSSTGMVGLGDFSGGLFASSATGVSRDGSVVVGYSYAAQAFRPFRWTEQTGMLDLGDLPGGFPDSAALAVSADGDTVAGYSYTAAGKEAFRWTQQAGMVSLGDLVGGAVESYARAISDDGKVIVGQATTADGSEAFRWTEQTGMQSLGSCSDTRTSAFSTSSDGSWITGNCLDLTSAASSRAFLWDAANGIRDLETVLVDDYGLGAELDGWDLGNAWVSGDGRTLGGWGKYQGLTQAWIVEFRGNIPEPAPIWLCALGLAALAFAKRLDPEIGSSVQRTRVLLERRRQAAHLLAA